MMELPPELNGSESSSLGYGGRSRESSFSVRIGSLSARLWLIDELRINLANEMIIFFRRMALNSETFYFFIINYVQRALVAHYELWKIPIASNRWF